MIHELTETVLLIFAALFPIINPPASAFIIMSLVPHASQAERTDLARRVAINSFFILLASLSIGAYVLQFFGISIPVLRVAGGVIITMAGWNLLQSSDTPDESDTDAEEAEGAMAASLAASADQATSASPRMAREPSPPAPRRLSARRTELQSKSFYPLTMPVTVGPGSISVAIALGTGTPRSGLAPVHLIGVAIALALLSITIYLCVRFAGGIERLLGPSGTRVAMRLFAFAIFCIGMQLLWLGLSDLLNSLHLH